MNSDPQQQQQPVPQPQMQQAPQPQMAPAMQSFQQAPNVQYVVMQ